MSILKIQTGADNEILRTKSKPIAKIDKKIKKLASDMLDTLNDEKGLGLAAPQVGVNVRMLLARFNHDTAHEMIVPILNPEITQFSKETIVGEEGCLSLPGIYKPVKRSKQVRLKFMDLKENTHVLDFEDLSAQIIQHELDHLDGILFIDRVEEGLKADDSNPISL
jgi:peptide deformylase